MTHTQNTSRPPTCDGGGYLVGAKYRQSTDPSERWRSVEPTFGCSQLRCTRCDAPVRSGPPFAQLKGYPASLETLLALYAEEDLGASERLKPDDESRLYFCRCVSHHCTFVDGLVADDEDSTSPRLPWVCAGHPPCSLPVVWGNFALSADTDWDAVVTRVLDGECPRRLERLELDEGPSTWLSWLYLRLDGLPVRDALSRAIARRRTDPDPLVVGRVLRFFTVHPRAEGAELLLEAFERAPEEAAVGYPIAEWPEPVTQWSFLVAHAGERGPRPLDRRAEQLFQTLFLLPRDALRTESRGSVDLVAIERARLVAQGRDPHSAASQQLLAYRAEEPRRRLDVIAEQCTVANTCFDHLSLRAWLTEHIVPIERASRGRWTLVMKILTDWYDKPATGFLIVIAGLDLLRSGLVSGAELRDWIDWRRAHQGWMDAAWIVPLESAGSAT